MAKMKKWNICLYVVGLLIFSYMIYTIRDDIWGNILETGWWFFPVIGIWLVVYIINTLAWNVIVRDKSDLTVTRYPSFLKMLKITISGYCINYITVHPLPSAMLRLQANVPGLLDILMVLLPVLLCNVPNKVFNASTVN
jgi:hypothetical protein